MAARAALVLALVLGAAQGCVGPRASEAPRVSALADDGDDLHRASQRLVLEGLDADVRGDPSRARGRYERALQIDASNPWVYLALARHYVAAGEARRALSHLDRAEALFESLERDSPGAQLHRDGLRGAALGLLGRHEESRRLLDAVARAAPEIWGDGRLDASELR